MRLLRRSFLTPRNDTHLLHFNPLKSIYNYLPKLIQIIKMNVRINIVFCNIFLKLGRYKFSESPAGLWKEKQQSGTVGNESRRNKQNAADENNQSVGQALGRKLSAMEIGLNFFQNNEALRPCHPGAKEACEQDEHNRIQSPKVLPHFD